MKIELEVPEHKVDFVMELLQSIPFIKARFAPQSSTQSTTEYLLSSSQNQKRLMEAIERSKFNQSEYHDLIEE